MEGLFLSEGDIHYVIFLFAAFQISLFTVLLIKVLRGVFGSASDSLFLFQIIFTLYLFSCISLAVFKNGDVTYLYELSSFLFCSIGLAALVIAVARLYDSYLRLWGVVLLFLFGAVASCLDAYMKFAAGNLLESEAYAICKGVVILSLVCPIMLYVLLSGRGSGKVTSVSLILFLGGVLVSDSLVKNWKWYSLGVSAFAYFWFGNLLSFVFKRCYGRTQRTKAAETDTNNAAVLSLSYDAGRADYIESTNDLEKLLPAAIDKPAPAAPSQEVFCLDEQALSIERWSSEEEAQSKEAKSKEKADPLVDRIVTYVERNIHSTTLNINTLSEALGVSRSHALKRFKKQRGLTLNEYIVRLRVEHAKKILLTKSVTETAFDLGFKSSSHFSTFFKKQVGMSPSQYKSHSNELNSESRTASNH